MLNEEIGKWVRVEEQHPTGKTRRFVVCTAAGDPIGEIRWWSGWRKYAFLPGRQTVFEPTCLRDISNFLDRLMVEYKAAKPGASNTALLGIGSLPRMKCIVEIDLPNETTELDSETLGAISRVLMSASDSFDVAYDEQEINHDYICEVDVHELPWRWKVLP